MRVTRSVKKYILSAAAVALIIAVCLIVYEVGRKSRMLPEDYPLLHAQHTLLTPHVAFLSEEAMVRRADIVFDNLRAWLDGKPVNVCL